MGIPKETGLRVRLAWPPLFAAIVLCTSFGRGATIFVNGAATGSDINGLSWQTAYHSVTNALEQAVAGDELWVAEGTYYGPMDVPSGVSLYGGFTGTETERTERDWMRHRSVLSQLELDWFPYIGIPESVVSLGAGSRLDGFAIANGYAEYGSGVYVGGPGCVVANNTVVNDYVSGVLGGAGVFVDVAKRFPTLAAEEFFQYYADAFLRKQFPFGVTNIPVYPANAYSPGVHRLLQVAANLYDAKGTDPLPSVFRPRFAPDPTVPGGVVISGYYLDNDPATVKAWLETNPYGIPMVLGARKGLPNFNELSLQTGVLVTRKLELRRANTNSPPFQTNQMYIIGISNTVGLECWNSYTQTMAMPLQMDATLSSTLRLSSGETLLANWTNTLVVISNFSSWPGFSNPFSPSSNSSFKVPLLANMISISNSAYHFGSGSLAPVNSAFETGVGFPIPQWELSLSNRLVYLLSSNSRIVDFVVLQISTNSIDLMRETLTARPIEGLSTIGACWDTNRGITSQIEISAGYAGISPSYWLPFSFTRPADINQAVNAFRGFVWPMSYPSSTNLIMEAPFSPARKLVLSASWQANDPLVHSMTEHLKDLTNNWITALVTPMTGELLQTNSNLGKLNGRYRPWGGRPVATPGTDPNEMNSQVKDNAIFRSDDWRFASGEDITVRWLDHVHRGTPWQTLYFGNGQASALSWDRQFMDRTAHPTNDWALVSLIRDSLQATGTVSPALVLNNTIARNAGGGLVVLRDAAVNFANNIVSQNDSGIFSEPGSILMGRNNSVSENGAYNYNGAAPGKGDLQVPARFKSPAAGDFSLLANSDLIDAGSDDVLSYIQRAGPTQVYGTHIDIGAHEFGPDGTPVITSVTRPSSEAAVEIAIEGFPDQQYVIDASDDLSIWTSISTTAAALGQIVFRDSQSTNLAHRFYRVRLHEDSH